MTLRAPKYIRWPVMGLALLGLAACVPPPQAPTTGGWSSPTSPPTCGASALASGDLAGCVLGSVSPSSQGFGVPPFPAVTTITAAPIPSAALAAYANAVSLQRSRDPGCAVSVEIVAAIGYNESRHAVNGTRIGAGGVISPPILGPLSSYPNTLSPEDRVRFQNTQPYLQAVGATQFMPTTWKGYEPDGNGDGVSDPFNIYDDAMGTAMYLCRVSRMTTEDQIRASIFSYGYRTPAMQDQLFAMAAQYAALLGGASSSVASAPTGWVWNGGAYNGSPVLAGWEQSLTRNTAAIGAVKPGTIVAPPDVLPLYVGFLTDLVQGGYPVREYGTYGFRCTSNSARRDCLGLAMDSLSLHAYGLAIDINWTANPERIYRSSATTSACAVPAVTDIPPWVVAAAQRWGLFWGGYGWSKRCPSPFTLASEVNRDPMHFEFRGTPDLARRIVAWNASHPAPPAAQPPR